MLQLLHLDVSKKIDWVLHMRCAWKAASGADDIWGGVGDVWGQRGPTASVLPHDPDALYACLLPLRGSVRTLAPRTDVRTLASPF
jgi:hypothetical protein